MEVDRGQGSSRASPTQYRQGSEINRRLSGEGYERNLATFEKPKASRELRQDYRRRKRNLAALRAKSTMSHPRWCQWKINRFGARQLQAEIRPALEQKATSQTLSRATFRTSSYHLKHCFPSRGSLCPGFLLQCWRMPLLVLQGAALGAAWTTRCPAGREEAHPREPCPS